ncbi:hypothetical protein FB451DRAFT_1174240 [Mycena latifolia]|nr:hypothetical protein FB451DRAFT_1174240 [Mycena latifolia]
MDAGLHEDPRLFSEVGSGNRPLQESEIIKISENFVRTKDSIFKAINGGPPTQYSSSLVRRIVMDCHNSLTLEFAPVGKKYGVGPEGDWSTFTCQFKGVDIPWRANYRTTTKRWCRDEMHRGILVMSYLHFHLDRFCESKRCSDLLNGRILAGPTGLWVTASLLPVNFPSATADF